ncbi:glycosyltransferase [Aliiglaciecola sp. LCG003]|uniref:glycosyltransferase n=1 Tax=Aliiglaciecola sp. LCG003 TaxID=3053655 RepID=UPI002573CEEF|nr:glycosyltransferase [Aliiglaciecola sp. LCG003]WJG09173.1 glycosyltransferase [Aliiglaciecola sp. LCG003]
MMTNTFTPHVGGVARSIESFTKHYQQQGHRVLVIAPEFSEMPENEPHVLRIPAMQKFNGSDFSVMIPLSRFLGDEIDAFEPDIVHSHHPFLVGSVAIRVAQTHKIPLVFTHHTMYEQYTHYVPGDSQVMKSFVMKLATAYANMCDAVIAPSQSIAEVLAQRGVTASICVVPTGVNVKAFSVGSGNGFRAAMGIPENVFLVGHIGRLAAEKNLKYLSQALIQAMQKNKQIHFLLVGSGDLQSKMMDWFLHADVMAQVHSLGFLEQPLLASAYRALDLFVFASKSETQGMVITEAMAASVPVFALDAPGVREVVIDNVNGRLLDTNINYHVFAKELLLFKAQLEQNNLQYKQAAIKTANQFSIENSTKAALKIYTDLLGKDYVHRSAEQQRWADLLPLIRSEFKIIRNYLQSAADAMSE